MIRRRTIKLRLYAGLVAGLLFTAVMLGRPELVVLATPFAVALVVGLALSRSPDLAATLALDRDRLLEGEPAQVAVDLRSPADLVRVELALSLSPRLTTQDRKVVRVVPVPADGPAVARFTVHPGRWGVHRIGPVAFRTHDLAGFHVFEGLIGSPRSLRVYPRPETLTALVAPAETRALAGNRRARTKGDGIEFADLRPFVAGDRVKTVNWRIAARGGGLWVNERHPEHNSDVIVFLDAFSDTALGPTVRAAAALVNAYGQQRDRVGLISFGGLLRWVQPGTGLGQLYRITEALIDTQAIVGYAWQRIDFVPARTLPPRALVLALSPLEDDRALTALANLRGRGTDLAVLEMAPTPRIEPDPGSLDHLGYRVWSLEREARRIRLRRLGVPVVEWSDQLPLAAVVEEASAFRRRARRRTG